MAAVIDIANRALGLLGDRANVTSIEPPEGSAQADHIARFWPMVRDTALAARDWSFASVYEDLTELSATFPGWRHVFAQPNNCLIIRQLRFGDMDWCDLGDARLPEYMLGSLNITGAQIIATNTPAVQARFTRRVVDPTRYSPHFTNAVTFLLAAYLAGPIIKGRAGSGAGDAMLQRYYQALGEADVLDANQSNTYAPYTPSNARVRGFTGRRSARWPARTDLTTYPGV